MIVFFIFISSLGALLGALFASATLFFARRYLIKSFTESLQQVLLNAAQEAPIPRPLEETARTCMERVVVRFREKMPFVGNFITPTIVKSMEEMMMDELHKQWPNLLQNMVPTLVPALVEKGLHDPALTKFWVGYSSLLGLLVGLFISIVVLATR